MPRCPVCETPGAYIGFTTVECRNPNCKHFVLMPEQHLCPCCGRPDHYPEEIPMMPPDGGDGYGDGNAYSQTGLGPSGSYDPNAPQ